jgi:hypothetical protein
MSEGGIREGGREGGKEGGQGPGPTHRARLHAEADEQEDLGHQDSKGEIGMDVVTLVPDGADRTEGRE